MTFVWKVTNTSKWLFFSSKVHSSSSCSPRPLYLPTQTPEAEIVHSEYPSIFRQRLLLPRYEVHCMLWDYWSRSASLPPKCKKSLTVIHKHKPQSHERKKNWTSLTPLIPFALPQMHSTGTATCSASWVGDANAAVGCCWVCTDASISHRPKHSIYNGQEKAVRVD